MALPACGGDAKSPSDPPGPVVDTAPTNSVVDTSPTESGETDSPPEDSGDTGVSDTRGGDTAQPPPDPLVLKGPAPQNLIVIGFDTLRFDHVGGLVGTEGGAMPALDGLLEQGVVWANHASCSNYTFASSMCLLTGDRAVHSGWDPLLGTPETVPAELPLLPELLDTSGPPLDSHLITANSVLGARTGIGARYDSSINIDMQPATDVVDASIRWLDESYEPAESFFLQVHFMDTHSPYTPPEAYMKGVPDSGYDLSTKEAVAEQRAELLALPEEELEVVMQELQGRYAGNARYMDDELARLWSELESRGALEQTLVVLWSDHGEQLLDHFGVGHGSSLYQEEQRAFVALLAPGLQPASWRQPTSHIDVLPTIFELMDRSPLEVAGQVLGQADPQRPVFSHRSCEFICEPVQLLQRGDLRLHYSWLEGSELYQVSTDPGERHDLYDPEAEVSADLWELLLPEVEALAALYGVDVPKTVGP